jgi:hypothetical protein
MKKVLTNTIQIIPQHKRGVAFTIAFPLILSIAMLIFLSTSCTVTPVESRTVAWPLKTSTNGRYLVDRNNKPFFINGDSPQRLMGSLSEADAEKYFANREKYGINAVWIHLYTSWGPKLNGDPFTAQISPPPMRHTSHMLIGFSIWRSSTASQFFWVYPE